MNEEGHHAERSQRLRLKPAAPRDAEHAQEMTRDNEEDGECPKRVEIRLARPLLDDDRAIDRRGRDARDRDPRAFRRASPRPFP